MVSTWYSCVFRAGVTRFLQKRTIVARESPSLRTLLRKFSRLLLSVSFLYLLLTTARKFPVTWSSEGKVRVKVPTEIGPGSFRTETKVEPPGSCNGPGSLTIQVNVVSPVIGSEVRAPVASKVSDVLGSVSHVYGVLGSGGRVHWAVSPAPERMFGLRGLPRKAALTW